MPTDLFLYPPPQNVNEPQQNVFAPSHAYPPHPNHSAQNELDNAMMRRTQLRPIGPSHSMPATPLTSPPQIFHDHFYNLHEFSMSQFPPDAQAIPQDPHTHQVNDLRVPPPPPPSTVTNLTSTDSTGGASIEDYRLCFSTDTTNRSRTSLHTGATQNSQVVADYNGGFVEGSHNQQDLWMSEKAEILNQLAATSRENSDLKKTTRVSALFLYLLLSIINDFTGDLSLAQGTLCRIFNRMKSPRIIQDSSFRRNATGRMPSRNMRI